MNRLNEIKISNRKIGCKHPPFVIAEMSGNHNHSLDRALELVEAAAKSGASALKLQTYTADTMTLDIDSEDFIVKDPNSPWCGKTLYNLYQEAFTPWEWHKPIFDKASELGMIAFSTPFDASAVDFLEELNVPCYKIASFENTDLPLIHKVASTGKPMIISTGMASIAELDDAVKTARSAGCKELILLKCTSTYPAEPINTNILTIPNMRKLFDCEVGLSDHTMGVGVAVASIALGASVIEKHFTLKRSDGGVDSSFSLEPNELHQLTLECKRAWQSLGSVSYGPTKSEDNSLLFRRSIYIVKDLKAGDKLSIENIKLIRPGFGLPAKNFDFVIGMSVNQDIKKGSALEWKMLR